MINPELSMSVKVDPRNPGQFFACCGLLELADRWWAGASGWFEPGWFHVHTEGDQTTLITALTAAELEQLDPDDRAESPIRIGDPFRGLRLDWWQDVYAGGKALKTWAGQQSVVRIARAMQQALRDERFHEPDLFNVGVLARDEAGEKAEPFYFDSRRAASSHPRDVGFSPDAMKMTTPAYPAVELLCLVGLQRCRPRPTETRRIYEYHTWPNAACVSILSPLMCGLLPSTDGRGYRFELGFRSGSEKYKAFGTADALSAVS